MMQALEQIRAHGDAGHEALLSLLKNEDVRVRMSAAAHLLETDPDKAKPVLEEAGREPGLIGFNAKMMLREHERRS
jgi:HEAT repeat protein